IKGEYQGFILDKEDFVVAGLPSDPREFSVMAEGYLFPFLENKYDLKRQRLTLKYFGERGALMTALNNAKINSDCDFDYSVTEKYGDFKVELLFKDKNSSESGAAVRSVVSELKENIYAEEDKTLSERLFDCLSVKNKKIAVAESFTGGRVVAEIIKNAGVSAYLHEGVVAYSNESKEVRLGVKKEHLVRDGAVSSVVAYDMAVGLLRTKKVDVAVATTGIAGPNSDNTKKPVGLCYIAVGTTAGVHTYKLNLKGTREEITETAKNYALFLTIKNLKRT
ncbi:MAG: nicotinamide-nucleotide amidohydrolase family protein, partial [Clostridia bacterium]|nr:nicotinamide-nucleotide amidohydrolase family protein [Clostridia bacterium]